MPRGWPGYWLCLGCSPAAGPGRSRKPRPGLGQASIRLRGRRPCQAGRRSNGRVRAAAQPGVRHFFGGGRRACWLTGAGPRAGRAAFRAPGAYENLDMIGRNPAEPVQVLTEDPQGRASAPIVEAASAAPPSPAAVLGPRRDGQRSRGLLPSGHPVPVLLHRAASDYHGVDDEAERLSYPRFGRSGPAGLEGGLPARPTRRNFRCCSGSSRSASTLRPAARVPGAGHQQQARPVWAPITGVIFDRMMRSPDAGPRVQAGLPPPPGRRCSTASSSMRP